MEILPYLEELSKTPGNLKKLADQGFDFGLYDNLLIHAKSNEFLLELLKAGADPNMLDGYYNNALHSLTIHIVEDHEKWKKERIDLLLWYGTNPHQPNKMGFRPYEACLFEVPNMIPYSQWYVEKAILGGYQLRNVVLGMTCKADFAQVLKYKPFMFCEVHEDEKMYILSEGYKPNKKPLPLFKYR